MTRRPRARGYILVDSMIALLVLALVLGVTLDGIANATRSARHVSDTRRALMLARSMLDAVGGPVPLAPGTTTGVDGDFVWRVAIDRAEQGGGLARVTVIVQRPGAPPLARLATLRLAAGQR